MKNKCIIIYESVYNDNTLKLARAMAQALGCRFITAGEAESLDLKEYETIGLGSGIYFGRHHPKLFELVEKLNSAHQNVFIFSSRGNPFLGKYHQPLKDVLIKKGKHLTGEFSVRGYDETGPWVIIGGGHKGKPDERDLKNAVRFVQKAMPQYCMPDYYHQIENKLPVRDGEPNCYQVGSNGNMVFLKGDRVTFNHNLCNGCGKCAEICPMGIIQLENSKAASAHELDCTLCRLCVMNCRQRAIALHYNWRDAIQVARRHSKRTSLY
jgi:NAD-dependent dihydropyrimidine dehydrogenase PreA subunit/flavodoxin